jgi:protein-S-isoprenylcysteine O-methyltransferase Ste14
VISTRVALTFADKKCENAPDFVLPAVNCECILRLSVEVFMTTAASGTSVSPDREAWPTTVASLIVGAAFFTLWFWLLPSWLGFRIETAGAARWRWIAAIPSVLGFAVALRCVWDFGRTGHGTPAPVAPPKKLVVVGFCRYVRNPMYLGFFTGWIGLWIVFGHANPAAIAVACAVVIGVAVFVRLYEEPTLRKMFGEDYEKYCSNVRRWLPRIHPWQPADRL